MNKLLILILVAFLHLGCNAQTYYYKLVKKVVNGAVSTKVSGGQFITFTKNGKCYESDKEGFSVENGSLIYVDDIDGYSRYKGTSYWGTSIFLFTQDKMTLNVDVGGNKYVFKRMSAPSGVTTCSYIKKNDPKPTPTPTPPIPQKQPFQEWQTCCVCHGQTVCQTCNGEGTVGRGYSFRTCVNCGGSKKCPFCSGQGGKYVIVYR